MGNMNDIDTNEAMHSWIRDCANPRSSDATPAVVAGLLVPADDSTGYRYVTTKAGNEWLINNAVANGSTRDEATQSLDYIDGAI